MNTPNPSNPGHLDWMFRHHAQPQPLPLFDQDNPEFIQDMTISDIVARQRAATEKYRTPGLQPFNGRSPWIDYYQEQLDALLYLKAILISMDEISDLANTILNHPDFAKLTEEYAELGYSIKDLFTLLAHHHRA